MLLASKEIVNWLFCNAGVPDAGLQWIGAVSELARWRTAPLALLVQTRRTPRLGSNSMDKGTWPVCARERRPISPHASRPRVTRRRFFTYFHSQESAAESFRKLFARVKGGRRVMADPWAHAEAEG